MNILITGGGISNKGAQSMLYITVEQMRKKYPQDKIVVMTVADPDFSPFVFERGKISYYAMKCLLHPMNRLKMAWKRIRRAQVDAVEAMFREARLLIDISGYALGSNWSNATVDYYLSCLECAKKFRVPVYVMPQSFGPFDYEEDGEMMQRIVDTMSYPQVVYAREQEGYMLMTRKLGLKNVKLSCDMVLRSKSAEPESVYRVVPGPQSLPEIAEHSVAVIPNVRNCDHVAEDAIIGSYCEMAEHLLQTGKHVYLLHHSREDADLCRKIGEKLGAVRVTLLEDDLDCFTYEQTVRQFDYIVASRYHAIVHALKNGVPCIAFGWAIKYKEVLTLFGLGAYAFDVRTQQDMGVVLEAIDSMNSSCMQIRQTLWETNDRLQDNGLFRDIG